MKYTDNSELIGKILHTTGDNRKYMIEPPTNGKDTYVNLNCIEEPDASSINYNVDYIDIGEGPHSWKLIQPNYEIY